MGDTGTIGHMQLLGNKASDRVESINLTQEEIQPTDRWL